MSRKQGLPGQLPGEAVQGQELAVVIEHLLEVGDLPVPIHRVAAEAPAHLVLEAPQGHALEGEAGLVAGILIRLTLDGAEDGAVEEQRQIGGVGKLRCLAKAAVVDIEAPLDLLQGLCDGCGIQHPLAGTLYGIEGCQGGAQVECLLGDGHTLLPIGPGYGPQEVAEGG